MTNSRRAERPPHTVMIVENLPLPPDRRVWQEALTMRDAGYKVSVICPKGRGYDAADETIEGVRILRHSLPLEAASAKGFAIEYSAALFHQFRLIMKLWFTGRFDVIHVANPPDLMFMTALAFKPFGVRLIYDHHDLTPELYFEKFGRKDFFHKLMLWLERRSFRNADAVISTNGSYKQIAVERGGKNPDDVFIVRSGPDAAKMTPQPPDPAIRALAPHIIGYVGIMGSQDGIDVLIRAAAHLVNDIGRKDAHFLLIGDGPELEAMKALAVELGVADAITFTGYLSGIDLHRALSSIDIGVCPDPCNDYTAKCTMNKIMEYMAFGKPLVQFDLTEGRFSAQSAALYAENGNIEDLARQMDRLLADPELRAEMGAYGRRRFLEDLSWDAERPNLLAAYARARDG